MNFRIPTIFSLFFFFCFTFLHSQRANIWYFGSNAGLNFNTTPPTALTNGQSNHVDNSSTISDHNGNLLFYTDGVTVWNKNHLAMSNGTGLIGHASAGQCCVIVPIPCDTNKYVIFHNTEYSNPGYLSYSVVDMSLNLGLGDVVSGQKNVSLGTGWTEKLCAYYNPNGNFYWVVAHKWSNNQFVAFKVDASSIATQSVTTAIGSVHSCGSYGGVHDAMGQLTISPDGTKIVNALTCQDVYELFDFNMTTGVLSNSVALTSNGGNAWGTAFSPSSQKLFTSSLFGQSIFEYDLSVYNQSTIQNSKVTLATAASSGYNFGYMELGPDGKVYIAHPNTTNLSVVNNPNNMGSASNFSLNGQSLGIKSSQWGLSRVAYNIQPGGTASFSLSVTTQSGTCNSPAGSVTITPSTTLALNYSISPGSYTSPVISGLAAGIYTAKVSDSGCSTVVKQFTITSSTSLILSLNSVTACANQTTQLNPIISSGLAPYNYTWMPGNQNTSSINISPGVTTSYTLFVSDSGGCSGTSTMVATVPQVTASFTYSSNVCTNIFTFNNSSPGATSSSWNFGDGASSSAMNPSHQYSSPGNYTVSLVAFNGGCSDSVKKVITAVPVINTGFAAQFNACRTIGSFTNTSTGATSYTWSFGDGYLSNAVNPGAHTYTAAGLYIVSLAASNANGCSQTFTSAVQVYSVASGYTYTSNSCTNSFTFTNQSSGANSYHWSFGDGGISTTPNPGHLYTTPGSYTVTLIAGNNGCNDTIRKTVAITQTVQSSFGAQLTSCGSLVTLTNTSQGATAYVWNFGDGVSSNLYNPGTHSYQSGGNYTIHLTATANNGCSETFSASVQINSVIANFNYSINPCTNSFTLYNTSSGASLYGWDFDDGASSSAASPTHHYATPGVYNIRLIASANGCSDTVKKPITISAPVMCSFITQQSFCNTTVSFTNSSSGASSYAWSFGDGATSSQQNPGAHSYSVSGNYTVKLLVTGSNGCRDSSQENVLAALYSVAAFTFSNPLCSKSIQLSNTSTLAGTYSWDFGDGVSSHQFNPHYSYTATGIYTITLVTNAALSCSSAATSTIDINSRAPSNFRYEPGCMGLSGFINLSSSTKNYWTFGDGASSTSLSPVHKYGQTGTYHVSLITNPASLCSDTLSQLVYIDLNGPKADFSFTNQKYVAEFLFLNLSKNASRYSWDFGDGSSSYLKDPKHVYNLESPHLVCLLATNDLNCTDTMCKVVGPDIGWTFYVPDTFTPDGDGRNDIFYVYSTNIRNFNISVFDRWGMQVFSSDDTARGWDGSYKGKPVPNDMFVWLAEFTDSDGKQHTLTGWVQVLM